MPAYRAARTASLAEPKDWFINVDGKIRGPFTLGAVARLNKQGIIREDTLVRSIASPDWQAASYSPLPEAIPQFKNLPSLRSPDLNILAWLISIFPLPCAVILKLVYGQDFSNTMPATVVISSFLFVMLFADIKILQQNRVNGLSFWWSLNLAPLYLYKRDKALSLGLYKTVVS